MGQTPSTESAFHNFGHRRISRLAASLKAHDSSGRSNGQRASPAVRGTLEKNLFLPSSPLRPVLGDGLADHILQTCFDSSSNLITLEEFGAALASASWGSTNRKLGVLFDFFECFSGVTRPVALRLLAILRVTIEKSVSTLSPHDTAQALTSLDLLVPADRHEDDRRKRRGNGEDKDGRKHRASHDLVTLGQLHAWMSSEPEHQQIIQEALPSVPVPPISSDAGAPMSPLAVRSDNVYEDSEDDSSSSEEGCPTSTLSSWHLPGEPPLKCVPFSDDTNVARTSTSGFLSSASTAALLSADAPRSAPASLNDIPAVVVAPGVTASTAAAAAVAAEAAAAARGAGAFSSGSGSSSAPSSPLSPPVAAGQGQAPDPLNLTIAPALSPVLSAHSSSEQRRSQSQAPRRPMHRAHRHERMYASAVTPGASMRSIPQIRGGHGHEATVPQMSGSGGASRAFKGSVRHLQSGIGIVGKGVGTGIMRVSGGTVKGIVAVGKASTEASRKVGKALKMSAPHRDQTPMAEDLYICGYLNKMSDGKWQKKTWHQRWFVLDKQNGILYYLKNKPTQYGRGRSRSPVAPRPHSAGEAQQREQRNRAAEVTDGAVAGDLRPREAEAGVSLSARAPRNIVSSCSSSATEAEKAPYGPPVGEARSEGVHQAPGGSSSSSSSGAGDSAAGAGIDHCKNSCSGSGSGGGDGGGGTGSSSSSTTGGNARGGSGSGGNAVHEHSHSSTYGAISSGSGGPVTGGDSGSVTSSSSSGGGGGAGEGLGEGTGGKHHAARGRGSAGQCGAGGGAGVNAAERGPGSGFSTQDSLEAAKGPLESSVTSLAEPPSVSSSTSSSPSPNSSSPPPTSSSSCAFAPSSAATRTATAVADGLHVHDVSPSLVQELSSAPVGLSDPKPPPMARAMSDELGMTPEGALKAPRIRPDHAADAKSRGEGQVVSGGVDMKTEAEADPGDAGAGGAGGRGGQGREGWKEEVGPSAADADASLQSREKGAAEGTSETTFSGHSSSSGSPGFSVAPTASAGPTFAEVAHTMPPGPTSCTSKPNAKSNAAVATASSSYPHGARSGTDGSSGGSAVGGGGGGAGGVPMGAGEAKTGREAAIPEAWRTEKGEAFESTSREGPGTAARPVGLEVPVEMNMGLGLGVLPPSEVSWKARGMVDLTKADVALRFEQQYAEGAPTRYFFQVTTLALGEEETRRGSQFKLCADTEEEFMIWTDAISAVINRNFEERARSQSKRELRNYQELLREKDRQAKAGVSSEGPVEDNALGPGGKDKREEGEMEWTFELSVRISGKKKCLLLWLLVNLAAIFLALDAKSAVLCWFEGQQLGCPRETDAFSGPARRGSEAWQEDRPWSASGEGGAGREGEIAEVERVWEEREGEKGGREGKEEEEGIDERKEGRKEDEKKEDEEEAEEEGEGEGEDEEEERGRREKLQQKQQKEVEEWEDMAFEFSSEALQQQRPREGWWAFVRTLMWLLGSNLLYFILLTRKRILPPEPERLSTPILPSPTCLEPVRRSSRGTANRIPAGSTLVRLDGGSSSKPGTVATSGHQGWGLAEASIFSLRVGPDYRRNKRKKPSAPPLLVLEGVDLIRTRRKLHSAVEHIRVSMNPETAQKRLFILNIQIPTYAPPNPLWGEKKEDGEGVSIIATWSFPPAVEKELLADHPAHPQIGLLKRFMTARNDPRIHDRFKLIAHVVNPEEAGLRGMERKLVDSYNAQPCLTRPQHVITNEPDYTEVDVDVHRFSYVARKGLYSLMGRTTKMVVDLCMVLEGHTDAELPETALGVARFLRVDLAKAKPLESYL